MSLHKPHHSLVNIPFSWENQPGISKVAPHAEGGSPQRQLSKPIQQLPRPPVQYSERPKMSPHGIYVPLPPCAFQPPSQRTPSRMGFRREEGDPFLAAYKECTKSSRKQGKAGRWSMLGLGFSCGGRLDVSKDAIVRRAKRPQERESDD